MERRLEPQAAQKRPGQRPPLLHRLRAALLRGVRSRVHVCICDQQKGQTCSLGSQLHCLWGSLLQGKNNERDFVEYFWGWEWQGQHCYNPCKLLRCKVQDLRGGRAAALQGMTLAISEAEHARMLNFHFPAATCHRQPSSVNRCLGLDRPLQWPFCWVLVVVACSHALSAHRDSRNWAVAFWIRPPRRLASASQQAATLLHQTVLLAGSLQLIMPTFPAIAELIVASASAAD